MMDTVTLTPDQARLVALPLYPEILRWLELVCPEILTADDVPTTNPQ
jgi:hypothetical protein